MHTTYYKSPIGLAEITADESAVLGVRLVDEDRESLDAAGLLGREVAILKQCVRELDEYFAGTRRNFDVKLGHASGTSFQKKVWGALTKIPFGKTFSYANVAREVGRPRAVRAVGAANGKNPHWILVPCHRVIGKSGALTGYAGGVDRKRWLLEHESS